MQGTEQRFSQELTSAANGSAWILRLRPHTDIVTSIAEFGSQHGLRRVAVLGCVGSLMKATLLSIDRSSKTIEGPGLEVVSISGWVDVARPDVSPLTLTVADREGAVSAGRPLAGGAPVCVTAEVIVQDWS